MRGAAFLSRLDDAVVVDVGGTTTDVGCLRHGFPREANAVVEVGGVRTLFRMPDLLSLGRGQVEVGPLGVFLVPAEKVAPVVDLARKRAAELLAERAAAAVAPAP